MVYSATKRIIANQNKKFSSKNRIALRRKRETTAYHLSISPPSVSSTIISQKLCVCGCNEFLESNALHRNIKRGHRKYYIQKFSKKIPCKCGCGKIIDSIDKKVGQESILLIIIVVIG